MHESFDVVIVGGAAVGSAAAYFLAADAGFAGRVLVLEQDPSYQHCATTRSLASLRHQFSTPENIRLSMFGTRFIQQAGELLAVNGQPAALDWRDAAYLFLATAGGQAALESNHRVQSDEGAAVALLEPQALSQRFPWLAVDDVALGSLGLAGEGWLDAHALLHAFRRKAISLGVQYRAARVVALGAQGRQVHSVVLDDGTAIGCGTVINAAGTGAAALARTAGIVLPVEPRKRCVFHFRSPAVLPDCP